MKVYKHYLDIQLHATLAARRLALPPSPQPGASRCLHLAARRMRCPAFHRPAPFAVRLVTPSTMLILKSSGSSVET
eukprot:6214777-Pleurochrysis_carterae.AAC.1